MSTVSINTVSSNLSITYGDYTYYLCNCSSGNITITLPIIDWDGMVLSFKRTDSSGNSITLTPYSGNTSDKVSLAVGESYKLVSFGTNWYSFY